MNQIKIKECAACLSQNVKHVMAISDHSISKENFNISECGQCGFRYTQDPPAEDYCGRYYQSEDYISHSDTSTGLIFTVYHWVRNIMLGRKYKLIQSLNGPKTLLDVGSGTGYFPAFMKDKGYEVMGIEVDDHARNYSQEKFGLNVKSPSDLKDGNIRERFGYITLWHVLEHLYQPDDYMKHFANLLTTDGHLIIAIPNFHSYDAAYYQQFWAAYDVPRHLWHFHPKAFEVFANRNGFAIIRKESMPFDPFYNAMLSAKYKKSALGMVGGMWTGCLALLKGLFDVNKASSVIYVMKKM